MGSTLDIPEPAADMPLADLPEWGPDMPFADIPEWGVDLPEDNKPPAMMSSTLRPGPFAGDSIPARDPERDWEDEEIEAIDRIGRTTGCHTCGTTDPGTKSGHFVPDHQPPSQLNFDNQPQRLYPHCIHCSRKQGGEVTEYLRKLRFTDDADGV